MQYIFTNYQNKMKKLFASLLIMFSFFSLTNVYADWTQSEEWNTESAAEAVNWGKTWKIPYCSWEYCSFSTWLDDAWERINWIQDANDLSAFDYAQKVVWYLLNFLYIVAVILIIYWWVLILMSAWEEDWVNKWKDIIKYTAIWIVVIFLANSIVLFIFDVLGQ